MRARVASTARRRTARCGLIALVALILLPCRAFAQETVSISFPAAVSFGVTNISATTTGTPNPSVIRFSNQILLPVHALRISVKAETADFTPPGGTTKIPASKASWTTSNANHGIGSNGTLSSVSYSVVFVGQKNNQPGGIDLTWTLAPPPSGIRAGTHTLTLRWKVEAITP
jgi:hypothetical protein